MKWWRKIPGWHRREVQFREWYIGLLDRIDLSHAAGYEQGLRVLRSPADVSGYREIRYPKMDQAREFAELEISRELKLQLDLRREVVSPVGAAGA